MAKYLTLDLLSLFKNKQDAANENKFMALENYVDANGKLKPDVVDVSVSSNVVPIHVVTTNGTTKYFSDNNSVATSTEIIGEIGKIYIDLESWSKRLRLRWNYG